MIKILNVVMINKGEDTLDILAPDEVIVPMQINFDNYPALELRPVINGDGTINFNRTMFMFGYPDLRESYVVDHSFEQMCNLRLQYEHSRNNDV